MFRKREDSLNVPIDIQSQIRSCTSGKRTGQLSKKTVKALTWGFVFALLLFILSAFSLYAATDLAASRTFGTPISRISDVAGDASLGYTDMITVEIIQVNTQTLQFNMEVADDIPLSPASSEGNVVYKWVLDTDQTPATGWPRTFVGGEFMINAAWSRDMRKWWGTVDVFDPPGTHTDLPVFVDGRTVSVIVPCSLFGNASVFDWQPEAFTDGSGGDSADTFSTAVVSSAPPPPGVISNVRISPAEIWLQGGQVTGTVCVQAYDRDGSVVPLHTHNVGFFSSNTSIDVTRDGVVSGSYGSAKITARIAGILSSNAASIVAGRATLTPPILLLSVADEPTGTLTVTLESSAGSPIPLDDVSVSFSSSFADVASVTDQGLVTAHRPPRTLGETPHINAYVDEALVNNAAVIRVTTTTLGLPPVISMTAQHVAFYMPPQVGSFDYERIFTEHQGARITDIAYELERELTGITPSNGGIQFLVNDPGLGDTVPCGLSGNPIRLGTEVDTSNSCFIVAQGEGTPQWGVFFHEMGHNFTLASSRFNHFTRGSDVENSNISYAEGLASSVAMYAAIHMEERQDKLGIPQAVLDQILPIYHVESTPDLDAYVQNGAHYDQLNPSVVYDIVLELGQTYGFQIIYRFFSAFLSPSEPYLFSIATDAQQATFFAAAMSAAAKVDLKPRFQDEWGFPIDAGFYSQIRPEVRAVVAGRDPIANAGPDRTVAVEQTVTLDGSASYQLLGGFLNYAWSFASRPAGSVATLADATIANPSFIPDVVGTYTLHLVVDNGVLSSEPDSVTVIASMAPYQIYLPLIARNCQPFEPQLLNLQTDPAGDWISPMPRSASMDIRQTSVWLANAGHLRFEMQLDGTIPSLPSGQRFYGWFLDTDLNGDTGQRYNDIGSDFNVQVTYIPDQGWVGQIFNIGNGGYMELASITGSGDTVAFTIPLTAIDSPSVFNWISVDQDDMPYYTDIVPNSGHIHTKLPTP